MSRAYVILGTVGFLFYGVSLGLFPIWMIVMAFIGTAVFGAVELNSIFRGEEAGTSSTFETTTKAWTTYLYQRENAKPAARANWNCKNCGGPNLQQVKCEWCGMVKE